jgi:6,7-dimethyl-8-ribityllumazine synthase
MPPTIEGHLDAKGLKVALIASRFNEFVTARLLEGALDALVRHGADPKNLTVIRAPGSFELPQVAAKVASQGQHDAIVALGCLIRGETPHFDLIAAEATKGLSQAGVSSGVPVAFGVLTCDTMEQAIDRAGGKAGNKGWDAAVAAIEMVSLFRRLT